jgi:hypothetical protein
VPRFRLSVRGLMVVVLVSGLLCWPIGLAAERAAAIRSEVDCSANLAAIGVAMHQFHAKYGHFPPAFVADAQGRPAHSWRVLLLEFLDPALFREYDFGAPWDSPHNRRLAAKMPRVYACPSGHGPENPSMTSYAVIVGPESAFPGSGVVKISDISDAAFNIPTILVAEVASMDIPWTEPRDLLTGQLPKGDNSNLPPRPGISSRDRRGAGLLMLDGQVRRVKPTIPYNTMKNMITISGNENYCDCAY